jgi:abequosyltransferase
VSDPHLLISIPTYDRADILEENLRRMAPALTRLGIPVAIFDDSPSELTSQAIDRLRADLELSLIYQRNSPSLGHDANVLAALTVPRADYIWLLGDSIFAEPEDVEEVHARLGNQDLLFLNCRDGPPTSDRANMSASDGSLPAFLAEQVWQLTMTGATIYGKNSVAWWRTASAPVYTNFPQLSVILALVTTVPAVRAEWMGQRIARSNLRKVSYWLSRAIPVFGIDWCAVITGYTTAFPPGSLPRVLRSHAVQTGVLGFAHLARMRVHGELPWSLVYTNWHVLTRCSSCARWQLALIAVAPARLLAMGRNMLRNRLH